MLRRISTACALAIAVLAACKKSQDDEAQSAPTPVPEVTPSAPPRVPPLVAGELGAQPGYLDGGLVYASVRIDRLQSFAQKLPLSPDLAGELAEVGSFFGLDFRVDDVRARFGITRDAVISMTLARPLHAEAQAVRAELTRGGPFLDALGSSTPQPTPPALDLELDHRLEPPEEILEHAPPPEVVAPPPEIVVPPPEPPEPPPRPSLEAAAQAQAFLRKVSTLGIHSRIHIPTDDPARLVNEVQRLSDRGATLTADICRAIPGKPVCGGTEDTVVVVREGKAWLDIDIVWFATPADRDAPGRIVAVREAVLASTVERSQLSALRGDLAAYLDVDAIEALATVDALGQAVRSLEWTPAADRRSTIDRRLERIAAVHELRATPMLYRGAALEVLVEGTRVQARLRWDVEPERAESAAALLTGPKPEADVPTLEALCNGAVACARTRGSPSPSAWRDQLAKGVFAAPQREVERTLGAGQEWAALMVVAGAWPNLVGAATSWPAQEIGRGPEAAIANNVVEAVGKIEGFGGSLRSVSTADGNVVADYAAYLRMKRSEVDLVRSMLAFAGLQATDTAIAGVDGTPQSVRLPSGSVPASLMLFIDPAPAIVPAGTSDFGWAALVDGTDRFAWLLGLPRERAAGPSAYFEIPDLWLLASIEPSIAAELAFARTWLATRHVRVAIDIVDGSPHVLATSDITAIRSPKTQPPD